MLGDYWGCLNRDITEAMSSFLGAMDEFVVKDAAVSVPDDFDGDFDIAIPLEYNQLLIDALMWLSAANDGRMCLVSHYPYVREGSIANLKITGVRPWEGHLEGLVYGKIGDFSLAFFDALFPISRDRYAEGETIPISLSGLGKSVHRLSMVLEAVNAPNLSDVQSAIEHVLTTAESKLMTLNFIEAKANIDDQFLLFGKIREHSVAEVLGNRLHRITISLLGDVVIPIVFGETSIETKNWQPAGGEFIAIDFFMQGYRTALRLK